MVRLNESQYGVLLEPLQHVDFNTLFVHAVISGYAEGKVFADSICKPKSFYIIHNYGMSLLLGDTDNHQFNNELFDYFLQKSGSRQADEWLQAFPRSWDRILERLVKDSKAVRYDRLNFSFDKTYYNRDGALRLPDDHTIEATTPDMYEDIRGAVIPKAFWRDIQQFSKACIGFTVKFKGEPVSTAFAAYLHDERLEIGIETVEKYRGKGLAYIACKALIDYCLENSLEPVWSCRSENTASANLAKKLGFRETKSLPYYHIPV